MLAEWADENSIRRALAELQREKRCLLKISRILADQHDQRKLLQDILSVLREEMQMSHGIVMMLSPTDDWLDVQAADQINDQAQADRGYRRGEGIIGQVVETGMAQIIPRLADEPRFINRIHQRQAGELREVSFICVPITLDAQTVGAISVDLPISEDGTLQQARQFLTIVASMIAFDLKIRRELIAEHQQLESEKLRLRDALGEQYRPANLIGNSKAMRAVYRQVQQVAATDTTALITGESGTGKELVANAIHFSSKRSHGPMVKVNCAALSENLLESELFGHVKGAFTGAVRDRPGRIAEAEGGTLFLDEIGEFSHAIQVKLLRVLQEREYEPVGSNKSRRADVRIIAATNRDLEKAVRDGDFREDLFYRVKVFPIHLPPLRERRDDILLLANHFVDKYTRRQEKQIHRISTPAINMLMMYHWPGNVRELENCIEHAVLMSDDDAIQSHNLPPTLGMPHQLPDQTAGSLESRVAALERDMISDALKRSNGNMAAAARELGITSRQIRYKIKNLKIDYDALIHG